MKFYGRVTEVTFMGYRVKVTEYKPKMPAPGPNHEITVGIRNAITGEIGDLHVSAEGIAEALEAIPTVHRYEILDGRGNGIVGDLLNSRGLPDE